MIQSPDSLVSILNFFMGFAYVIGLHNWMKKLDEKIPRTAKIRPRPICLSEEFFETKQNNIHSNKKPKAFADEPPSANKTFFSALSQGLCADWLVCTAYCIS